MLSGDLKMGSRGQGHTQLTQRFALSTGAWVDFWPSFLGDHAAWMGRLLDEVPLSTEQYTMRGRVVTAPRLVSWHGDPGTAYRYSGVVHEPVLWTPSLRRLRERLEAVTALRFNAVLCNYYRDGRDSMGWHADGEPEVGPSADDRWIASLSLGASRRFLLRHRKDRADALALDLGGGSLLVMRGTTQTHYRHALPKTTRPVGPRFNLTFRHIV